MKKLTGIAALAVAVAMPGYQAGAEEIIRYRSAPNARILEAAEIPAGTTTLLLSGLGANPVEPGKAMSDVKTVADLGDTKTQAISALNKIRAILASKGYSMRDLIKMTAYIAADPATGKADFAGWNAGFVQFFNTAENPETLTRSTVQVAGLVHPAYLVELEVMAAKIRK
jgi:enamine deaminase RidA (YjgF/YER057c/UK114 family)